MDCVSPDGPVYQAGTLSGNPVAMAAGYCQLEECLKPGFYEGLESKTAAFVDDVQSYVDSKAIHFTCFMLAPYFGYRLVIRIECELRMKLPQMAAELFRPFFDALIERGVYVGPSSYEVGFVSEAHTESDLTLAAKAIKEALDITFA